MRWPPCLYRSPEPCTPAQPRKGSSLRPVSIERVLCSLLASLSREHATMLCFPPRLGRKITVPWEKKNFQTLPRALSFPGPFPARGGPLWITWGTSYTGKVIPGPGTQFGPISGSTLGGPKTKTVILRFPQGTPTSHAFLDFYKTASARLRLNTCVHT